MSTKMASYFLANGIGHQLLCPYPPQQNGRLERRHRTIFENGLSMLFHSQVPTKFSLESFQTVVYLMNRRPTSVLPGKVSPQIALFGKQPDYSSLKVWMQLFSLLEVAYCQKVSTEVLAVRLSWLYKGYKGYLCYHAATKKLSLGMLFSMNIFPLCFLQVNVARSCDCSEAQHLYGLHTCVTFEQQCVPFKYHGNYLLSLSHIGHE